MGPPAARYAEAYDEHQKNKGLNISLLAARTMNRYAIKRAAVPPAPLRATVEAGGRNRLCATTRFRGLDLALNLKGVTSRELRAFFIGWCEL